MKSSWWGRESWLLCWICLPGVSWWLSGSSSRCYGFVCGCLWLWYFLIILTYYFWSSIVDELFEISVKFPKGNDLTEVINGYKRFGFPNFWGKIDGRHILIIALSEHHVDNMNCKGRSLRYHAVGTFSPICTSDGLDSCTAPGFWQTLFSIAEVKKRHCSEIEPCKSKPIDQKFQLFCLATRHSRWSSDYRAKPWP